MDLFQRRFCGLFLLLATCAHCIAVTYIPSPPTMIRQPPHELLFRVAEKEDESDKPFILECVANGNPQPEYWWLKDGRRFDYAAESDRIAQNPGSGTLSIVKPRDSDEGVYQCFAENVHGTSLSNAVHVRKTELNSSPSEYPIDVYVTEGEPLTLVCIPPSGYPKPITFWIIHSLRGSLHSINSSRMTSDPEGKLHFSQVIKNDALDDAVYACVTTSMYRNEYKIGIKIALRVEPSGTVGENIYPVTKQYTSPSSVVVLRGENLRLTCIYGGTPLPVITWIKEGDNSQSSHFAYGDYGKALKIKNVDFQDEGIYKCTASNGIGNSLSHLMSVKVQAAPFWLNVSENTIAAEEETVSFECNAGGVPAPEIEWLINGVPIADATKNLRRKLNSTTGVLTIENVTNSDTAVFQCNASNVHGYAFRNFYLNVLALPPTITEIPDHVTMAVISSTVTLRCRAVGSPKPVIKWLRDENELEGDRFQVHKNGDMEIRNVSMNDNGIYKCYASNKFGDDVAKSQLEVKSKTTIVDFSENRTAVIGNSVTFVCNAIADSSLDLNIEWLFNGKSIDLDVEPRMVKLVDNSLVITKVAERDSGVYTCLAKTELDQNEASTTLIVQVVPGPPQLTGVHCDGLTALVEWQPGDDGHAPITRYSIQYSTSFTPEEWDDAFASIPASDFHFRTAMSPWANYTFRVIAHNKVGPSLPSNNSDVCTTPEDEPYRNPENVVGKGTERDNLVISWEVMPQIEQNAPGFFYRVFWKISDIPNATWEEQEIFDWRQSRLIIPYQPTFRAYEIKVEAHNEKGQARVAARNIIGYSGEDVPLEAPQNLQVHVSGARSALIQWDPVNPESIRGHFRGYKIQHYVASEGLKSMREYTLLTTQPHPPVAFVTNFRPNSLNVARVLVFNEGYMGPPSEEIEFTTPEGVPGPVASFDALPLGSDALYLMWKPPIEPNGILTGYKIYYKEVQGTVLSDFSERNPAITDPTETKTKLAGLKPKTRYQVKISATTRMGKGESYFVEVETNQQAEEAPDEPHFIWSHIPDRKDKAGVKITWIPAVHGHSGSYFFVMYRKKGDTIWESTEMEEIEFSTNVEGLEFGSLYEMKLVAVDGRFQMSSEIQEIET